MDESYSLSSPLSSSTGTGLMAATQKATLTGNYDLPLAERQPLEIRVTQLDIGKLKQKTIGYQRSPVINTLNPEYMLPYSGMIYASRDDAAPDRSDRTPNTTGTIDATRSKISSSTDSRLDPSRRPHGIMLINGGILGRPTTVTTVTDVLKEKGLLLVSNLPVYIQGTFNNHTKSEFEGTFSWTPSDFYGRSKLDANFACRLGDPRYPGKCANSDNWRAATVVSDAITLLSKPVTPGSKLDEGFRYGFRNHGDFDLRNNAGSTIVGYDFNGDPTIAVTANEADFGFDLNGRDADGDGNPSNDAGVPETEVTAKAARMINGFDANNYVTNGLSSNADSFDIEGISVSRIDEDYSTSKPNAANSSYFNNFVTPVQRRTEFPEYVMEICRKLPVSACGPNDWVVGIDANNNSQFEPDPDPATNTNEREKASLVAANTDVGQLLSGTTAKPARDPADRRYPRRVAFVRHISAPNQHQMVLDGNIPVALGINATQKVDFYAASAGTVNVNGGSAITTTSGTPKEIANSLWYATTTTPPTPADPTGIDYGNNKPLYYAKLPAPAPLPSTGVANTVEQPHLRPILQIRATTSNSFAGNSSDVGLLGNQAQLTRWVPKAIPTEFNLIVASNDVPSRALSPTLGETNGGMQNLPRFMENWDGLKTTIAGSFIQFKRSAYATAPYQSVLTGAASSGLNASLFDTIPPSNTPTTTPTLYNVRNLGGSVGYFTAPDREWGFDVGLLSQPPDLFAQKFTLDATQKQPDEYFREISRDDDWVKSLLCAKKLIDRTADPSEYATNNSATKPAGCP